MNKSPLTTGNISPLIKTKPYRVRLSLEDLDLWGKFLDLKARGMTEEQAISEIAKKSKQTPLSIKKELKRISWELWKGAI